MEGWGQWVPSQSEAPEVMVLTRPIWAAASADRGPERAGQCPSLPRTEPGAVGAGRRKEGSGRGERVEVIAQVTVAHGRGGWCARGGAQARLLPASSGDRGTAALSLGLQVGSQVPAAAARQSVSLTPLPCSTPGAKEAKVPQLLSREGQA